MRQRLDILTLGVADVAAARRFYVEGLGWEPTLDLPGEIVFVQVGHGLLLALWDAARLEADAGGSGPAPAPPGPLTLQPQRRDGRGGRRGPGARRGGRCPDRQAGAEGVVRRRPRLLRRPRGLPLGGRVEPGLARGRRRPSAARDSRRGCGGRVAARWWRPSRPLFGPRCAVLRWSSARPPPTTRGCGCSGAGRSRARAEHRRRSGVQAAARGGRRALALLGDDRPAGGLCCSRGPRRSGGIALGFLVGWGLPAAARVRRAGGGGRRAVRGFPHYAARGASPGCCSRSRWGRRSSWWDGGPAGRRLAVDAACCAWRRGRSCSRRRGRRGGGAPSPPALRRVGRRWFPPRGSCPSGSARATCCAPASAPASRTRASRRSPTSRRSRRCVLPPLLPWPLLVARVVAVSAVAPSRARGARCGARRRRRGVDALVALMAQAGFSGEARYALPGAALVASRARPAS